VPVNNHPYHQIEDLLDHGEWSAASAALADLWRNRPTASTASYVVSRYDRLQEYLQLPVYRLAILRSFTVEPAVLFLRAVAFANGLCLTVQPSEFNAYAQAILDPNSNLYSFEPDVVILAVQTRDIAPELWNDFADLSPNEIAAAIERVAVDFRNWVVAFRSHSETPLVLHTLEAPLIPSNGLALDAQGEVGQAEAIRRLNLELLRLAREHAGVYLLDYDALVARYGRAAWHDESKWLTMRMPIAASCLIQMANEWLRFLQPLTGRSCKALVTDLDNTLWGGIIGEDGLSGIRLGPEYPGAAFRSLQRAILDLYRRGIILAVCSKNNLSDAMEVLESHPGMLLRPHHFAVLRINWNDKAQNLREIAAELNIGVEALAFLDDSPIERKWIRSQLPEATVIDLPDDPMAYASALRESPAFERLSTSAEDRERGHYYAGQRLRTELKQSTASLEEFYRSLLLEVDVSLLTPQDMTRVAQLTQKTNQFNLTTRRYNEQQIGKMAAGADWRVYTVRVRDRFGDNGLVGVAITHLQGRVCEIDTFLLSCRVIGRTVETALLATIAEQARLEGAQRLVGSFLPTKKNAPAGDFYRSHGFTCIANEDSEPTWEVDLTSWETTSPPWIKRRTLIREKEGVAYSHE
jgi:FkbH-like protein